MESLPEQFDSSAPEAKMTDIETRYRKLDKFAQQRSKALASTLPRLKLYANSLDNWEATLNGWEESVLHLAPPSTAVLIIQSTIGNIKVLLLLIHVVVFLLTHFYCFIYLQ